MTSAGGVESSASIETVLLDGDSNDEHSDASPVNSRPGSPTEDPQPLPTTLPSYYEKLEQKILSGPPEPDHFSQVIFSSALSPKQRIALKAMVTSRVEAHAAGIVNKRDRTAFLKPFSQYMKLSEKATTHADPSPPKKACTSASRTFTSSGSSTQPLLDFEATSAPSVVPVDLSSFSVQPDLSACQVTEYTYHSTGAQWFKNSKATNLFPSAKVVDISVYEGKPQGTKNQIYHQVKVLNPNSHEYMLLTNKLNQALNSSDGEKVCREHRKEESFSPARGRSTYKTYNRY